jgi:hypothetical protein
MTFTVFVEVQTYDTNSDTTGWPISEAGGQIYYKVEEADPLENKLERWGHLMSVSIPLLCSEPYVACEQLGYAQD